MNYAAIVKVFIIFLGFSFACLWLLDIITGPSASEELEREISRHEQERHQ